MLPNTIKAHFVWQGALLDACSASTVGLLFVGAINLRLLRTAV